MKYPLFLFFVLLMAACGPRRSTSSAVLDSLTVVDADADSLADGPVNPMAPIKGMEVSDLPEYGIKAWIEDGMVYWNIYNRNRYLQASHTDEEFYRCGDGPFLISDIDETPVGVFLTSLGKHNVVLYLITHNRNLYAYDVSLEVSGVGGGVGQIPYLKNIEKLRREGSVVMAVDSEGETSEVHFYSDQGPYQFEIVTDSISYQFELSSTWNMRLVAGPDNYVGRFQSEGDGTFSYALTRHFRYDDDYKEVDMPTGTLRGTFRINDGQDQIIFQQPLLGLKPATSYDYEVFALFN